MSNNPLKQYFRRPAIYIKLPSKCKFYDDTIVQKKSSDDFAVYPMTAIDEITSRTPDAVMNGQAVVDIIQSCIPDIKNAWEVNTIDLDTLLIAIRIASTGENMDVESKCPSCETETTYGTNLVSLLDSTVVPNYDQELVVNDLKIKFKPLTWKEINRSNMAQFEIQKMMMMIQSAEDSEEKKEEIKKSIDKLNNIMIDIIVQTIGSISTPETTVTDKSFIIEFLKNCDRATNKMISDTSVNLKAESQLKPLHIKCANCGHEYSQRLIMNISDFFE